MSSLNLVTNQAKTKEEGKVKLTEIVFALDTYVTSEQIVFFFFARMKLTKSASSRSKRRRREPHQTTRTCRLARPLVRRDHVTSARHGASVQQRQSEGSGSAARKHCTPPAGPCSCHPTSEDGRL